MNGRILCVFAWLLLSLGPEICLAQTSAAPSRAHAFSSSVALNAQWTPVGPAQITTGSYGPITGRITSIAVDPADPTGNTVLIGATGGGVWKSVNAAATAGAVRFSPLTDNIPAVNYTTSQLASLSIGALTVQPGNTGVILAGTGDPNGAPDSYWGNGILRSADGGATWSLITQTEPWVSAGPPYAFFGLSFAGFAWSTVSPNLVVAAVADSLDGFYVNAGYGGDIMMGLYYSQDAGVNWQLANVSDGPNQPIQSPNILFSPGFTGSPATSVVWNPVRQVFIAAIRSHGYYQSSDGVNWTRLPNQPGAGLSRSNCPANPGFPGAQSCPMFRGVLAVQPATGDTFALTTDAHNDDEGLFQDVCGIAGTQLGSVCANPIAFAQQLPSAALEAGNGEVTIPQASYNLWLKAVPQGGDTLLFAGTTDIYRCTLSAGCIWRNTTNANGCAAARVTPAQHAVDWAPGTATLFFGNDGGLWRTTDAVNQQQPVCSSDDANHFDNLNAGLSSLADIAFLAQDPSNAANLLAGLGHSGTAAGTTLTGPWQQTLSTASGSVAIDPADPQNWYATSGAGVAISQCTEGAQCGPGSFAPAIGETQVQNDGLALTFPAVWILDPANTANLLLGTCRVWRGPANGVGWSAANALSPMLDGDNAPACQSGQFANAQIRSLAASGQIAGRSDGAEIIYAGTAGVLDGGANAPGRVYRALVTPADSAATAVWTDLSLSPVTNDFVNNGQFNPGGFDVSSIAVDPHDPTGQTVYVSLTGFSGSGLIETVSSPFIYRSTDGGQHWSNITSNGPSAPVNALAVDPNDPEILYAGSDDGVFVTTSVSLCAATGAECWNLYGAGLPAAPVRQLQTYTGGGQTLLRAATYGRGLWQVGLASQSPSGGTVATAAMTPTGLVFTPTAVGTTSAYQSVTLTNNGSVDLQIQQIQSSGDFVQQNNCPAALSAGASCTINVAFAPSAPQAANGVLAVNANVSGGQLTVALSGQGTSPGVVVLTPSRLDFGSALVSTQTATQYLTVANTGGASIQLQTPAVTGNFLLTANTCGATLPQQTSCTVGIAFAPTAEGPALGQFSITDDAGAQTAPLTGLGMLGPTDVLAPLSLTFGPTQIGAVSAAQSVTLTNNGDAPLTLIQTTITGAFAVNNLCGAALAPHSTCAMQVTFVPKTLGPASGQLIVQDALHSQIVLLNGAAAAGAGVSLTPATLDFGVEGVGGASSPQTVTLTNNGLTTVSSPQAQISGDYALSDDACTADLAPGQNCTMQVIFRPSTTGTRSGVLSVASASLPAAMNASLSGAGMDFQLAVEGNSTAVVVSGSTATFLLQADPIGQSSGSLSVSCEGAPPGSVCTLSPSPLILSAGATSTLSVSISPAASASLRQSRVSGSLFGSIPMALGWLLPLGWAARRRPRRLALVLAIFAALGAAGCGVSINGGSAGQGGGSSAPGSPVPSGTYTLTVTASAPGVQHAVNLTLKVE